MAEEPDKIAADIDLDEDLFNFDEVMPDEPGDIEEEIDLDEIFAAFQEDEDEEEPEEEEEDVPVESVAEALDDSDLDDMFDEADLGGPEEGAEPAAEAEVVPAAPTQPAAPAAAVVAAAQPAAAPVAVAAAAAPQAPAYAPRAVTFLTKGAVVVLLAMTLLNVSIALVTFSSATGMRTELEAASRQMADAALEIRERVDEQAVAVRKEFSPLAPMVIDEHPTLDRAEADIEVGDYAEARQRIFSLMSVIDRQPRALRTELEAQAAYLLARSYHAESLARSEDQ